MLATVQTISRPLAICLALLALTSVHARAQASFKFDFGTGPAAPGYTKVTPDMRYPGSGGFGFESSGITAVSRGGSDVLRGDYVTSGSEMLFSIKLPQGDYNVTFYLGDAQGTSSTTVRCENWRVIWDRATSASGQFLTRTYTLDRREAKSLDGSVTMGLKDRELSYLTWDDKLTLQFSGSKSALAGMDITPATDNITIYLCGNSTVVDQPTPDALGFWSWGQLIPMHFKSGVSIANYAESGLDAGAFLGMRRLAKILSEAKEGDYVFVEFGHNDQSKGAGVYTANLKTFRDQIVAKKVNPVFVSPTARKGDGDPKTSIGGLAEAMRMAAVELKVPLIDLNDMSITVMKSLGGSSGAAYKDGSHFTLFGSFELARCVAKGIKAANNSLTPFLLNDLPEFDPSKPDAPNYFTAPGVPVSLMQVPKAPPLDGKIQPFQGGRNLMRYSPAGKDGAEFLTDGKQIKGPAPVAE